MNGERVRIRRKELGLTSEKIAQELGTTRVTVSRWENGTSEPDDKTKIALAKLLRTTVSYLLNETDDPYESRHRYGTCVFDEQGNIVCMWGNGNRITLLDNTETRQILHDFFYALFNAGYVSNEDVPSDILRIIPLDISNAKSKEEIAHIVQKAINKAFPDSPIGVNVVVADERMEEEKNAPVVSAYNGNNSSYTGNSLAVGAMA